VKTPRLDLPLLSPELLEALAGGDPDRARRLAPFELPASFDAEERELFTLRREQAKEPAWRPWLLRAIVLREHGRMVGYANFHGPPGVNDTGTPDALEIGYTVFPEFRRQGFATEAAQGLLDFGRHGFGVTHFIAGILPSNTPSMRVVEKLGFVRTSIVVEDEIIFELRFPPSKEGEAHLQRFA
jgi:ribosomal-protein-alanine N-acetyltransferase